MKTISREQLKDIFQKVKHFRIPSVFDEVQFTDLSYFSFYDGTDSLFYTVYEFEGMLEGIRWQVSRPPSRPLTLGLCDICQKHRKRDEIVSVYTQTVSMPKNVNYRSRGFQICFDYLMCNADLTELQRLDFIFSAILKD